MKKIADEKIKDGEKVLAEIIRGENSQEGLFFYTPDDNPLQLGKHHYSSSKVIKPHRHKAVPVNFTDVLQEVLYIEKGRVLITFYSDDEVQLDQKEVAAGDIIILMRGGHSFEFLEETKMIEVKQGPYNPDSTIRFEGKAT